MNEKLKEKIRESMQSVLPITVIVLALCMTLVPMEVGTLLLFLTGAVLLIIGMGFFQLGAEIAMTPLGQGVGGRLVKSNKMALIVAVSFAVGAIITIAEPDLQVLANQVAAIPNQVLILTVAAGVGAFLVVSVLNTLKQRFQLRNHRKLLLIDGRIAYSGGINISEENERTTRVPRNRHIHDLHCRITGPGADLTPAMGIHPDYRVNDLGELQQLWLQEEKQLRR